MAAKKKTENVEKQYIVTIKKNKTFCGEGAGGAQFAHGTATITDEWLAEWFRTHEGYEVSEEEIQVEEVPTEEVPAK